MAETVDLLVIGGGINGVGVARDAVGRGLSLVPGLAMIWVVRNHIARGFTIRV